MDIQPFRLSDAFLLCARIAARYIICMSAVAQYASGNRQIQIYHSLLRARVFLSTRETLINVG